MNLRHPIYKLKNLLRKAKWAYQRVTRGYSDCDQWNLCEFLSRVIAPAVKQIRENNIGYPASLTEEEWEQILAKIEAGFRAATDLYEMNYDGRDEADALEATFREGMDLFSKWFHSLWD